MLTNQGITRERFRITRGAGGYERVVSPQLLDERERVVLRPTIRKYPSKDAARDYVNLFRCFATQVDDPGDDYRVSLAQVADMPCLVSGDPHLTALPHPLSPVLTPRAFLKKIVANPAPH